MEHYIIPLFIRIMLVTVQLFWIAPLLFETLNAHTLIALLHGKHAGHMVILVA